jgi:N-acylneuraminate cytidylyltransferase/CMP-N,N'-diacetyllegionaminic acid synthase
MINNRSIVALIPARGGSEGLPGKNTKLLCGKPLIGWTIEHAIKSKYLDDILVSTDCEKIADISKKYGANVPFLRPKELATDDAKAIDVIIHAIDYLKGQGRLYDLVMYLQPTSPLREPEDIDCAIESLFSSNAQVVVGVCETEYPSYAMNTLPPDRCMKHFLKPELINKNRQDIPIDYRINGAIYLAYSNYLKLQRTMFGEETYAYIMPRERSVDIDTELDFKFAEFILKSR